MVIRGEGQLKKAMTIIASGAILNIILDPIFITILNPYGMGIEAAGDDGHCFFKLPLTTDYHVCTLEEVYEQRTGNTIRRYFSA